MENNTHDATLFLSQKAALLLHLPMLHLSLLYEDIVENNTQDAILFLSQKEALLLQLPMLHLSLLSNVENQRGKGSLLSPGVEL